MSQRTCYEAATPIEIKSALDRSVRARRNTQYDALSHCRRARDAAETPSGGKACDGVSLPSGMMFRSRSLFDLRRPQQANRKSAKFY